MVEQPPSFFATTAIVSSSIFFICSSLNCAKGPCSRRTWSRSRQHALYESAGLVESQVPSCNEILPRECRNGHLQCSPRHLQGSWSQGTLSRRWAKYCRERKQLGTIFPLVSYFAPGSFDFVTFFSVITCSRSELVEETSPNLSRLSTT